MASQEHAPAYYGQVEIGSLGHKLENPLKKEERIDIHVALPQYIITGTCKKQAVVP